MVHQPGHRGPQVVVLELQPVQPCQLPLALQLGLGLLGQRQEIGSVPVMRLGPAAAVSEPFQRILPDGLQQPEPRLAPAGFRPERALALTRTGFMLFANGDQARAQELFEQSLPLYRPVRGKLGVVLTAPSWARWAAWRHCAVTTLAPGRCSTTARPCSAN